MLKRFPSHLPDVLRAAELAALPHDGPVRSRHAVDWMAHAALVVVSYPDTPFIEALLIGTPTIGLWPTRRWPLREDAREPFARLARLGVVFDDPDAAAAQLDAVAADPGAWWRRADVRRRDPRSCRGSPRSRGARSRRGWRATSASCAASRRRRLRRAPDCRRSDHGRRAAGRGPRAAAGETSGAGCTRRDRPEAPGAPERLEQVQRRRAGRRGRAPAAAVLDAIGTLTRRNASPVWWATHLAAEHPYPSCSRASARWPSPTRCWRTACSCRVLDTGAGRRGLRHRGSARPGHRAGDAAGVVPPCPCGRVSGGVDGGPRLPRVAPQPARRAVGRLHPAARFALDRTPGHRRRTLRALGHVPEPFAGADTALLATWIDERSFMSDGYRDPHFGPLAERLRAGRPARRAAAARAPRRRLRRLRGAAARERPAPDLPRRLADRGRLAAPRRARRGPLPARHPGRCRRRRRPARAARG